MHCSEIQYGLDVLKFDGIGFMTNYGGKYLGDPRFAPVWTELNRRKALVYTHPIPARRARDLVPESRRAYRVRNGHHAHHRQPGLQRRDQQYPDIRCLFSHAGGTMPFFVDRFQEAAKEPPR